MMGALKLHCMFSWTLLLLLLGLSAVSVVRDSTPHSSRRRAILVERHIKLLAIRKGHYRCSVFALPNCASALTTWDCHWLLRRRCRVCAKNDVASSAARL